MNMGIMNYIDSQIINLGIGFLALLIANIALGTGIAIVDNTQKFELQRFIRGIIKAIFVIVSFGLVYIAGTLNADVITVEISGQTVNLVDGINIILTVGAGIYAKRVFEKISEIIALTTRTINNK